MVLEPFPGRASFGQNAFQSAAVHQIPPGKGLGYHETITRFWLALVREFLRSCGVDSSFSERVNALIQLYRDKNVLFEFYSRDRVMSDHAREVWIEPDLKHLNNL